MEGDFTPEQENTSDLHYRVDMYPPSQGETRGSIIVGNSGLLLHGEKQSDGNMKWEMHYVPDGSSSEPDSSAATRKNAEVFLGAAYALVQNADEIEQKMGSFPKTLDAGETNLTMAKFIKKNFGEAFQYHKSKGVKKDSYTTQLDLDLIRNDPNLMHRLKKIHDRSLKRGYKMKWVI